MIGASHIRSLEERTFQQGSEPPIEPLTVGDLAGPWFMYFLFVSLSLLGFGVESLTWLCIKKGGGKSNSRTNLTKVRTMNF